MRKYGRVDANQTELVRELRLIGCSVVSTASLGNGFPDIVVGYRGSNYLFEIKILEGVRNPKPAKLTTDEVEFMATWKGQVHVATCLYDILSVINANHKFINIETKLQQ